VNLDTGRIVDWTSFHQVFAQTMGFPDFYGANMNAWNDCMSDLRRRSGMVAFEIGADETLALELGDAAAWRRRCPELFLALVESSHFVNQGFLDARETEALVLDVGTEAAPAPILMASVVPSPPFGTPAPEMAAIVPEGGGFVLLRMAHPCERADESRHASLGDAKARARMELGIERWWPPA
jgi:hypothetical protein